MLAQRLLVRYYYSKVFMNERMKVAEPDEACSSLELLYVRIHMSVTQSQRAVLKKIPVQRNQVRCLPQG